MANKSPEYVKCQFVMLDIKHLQIKIKTWTKFNKHKANSEIEEQGVKSTCIALGWKCCFEKFQTTGEGRGHAQRPPFMTWSAIYLSKNDVTTLGKHNFRISK